MPWCKQCGLCTIQDLQTEAERLGYPVLVAEGSALVMALIQTGKIDAIVGVSCLSVLEKAFPFMEAAAIPGVAIPLLQDDCKDTTVDLDWVWDVIHLTSDDRTRRLDLDALRKEVESWFTPDAQDDIEDNDAERYGEQTLHTEHGVPIALNAGDLLIGEGYRLLAESGAEPSTIAGMIRIAADGHRQ